MHVGECRVDRPLVRLADRRLRGLVPQCPKQRDRLRSGEGQIEAGDRPARPEGTPPIPRSVEPSAGFPPVSIAVS